MSQKNIACIFGASDSPKEILQKLTPKCVVWITPQKFFVPCEEISLHVGQIGACIDFLNSNSITHILIVGSISRPSLFNLSLDKKGFMWLKKLGKKFFQGDDSLLKGIEELFKEEGFELISSSSVIDMPKKGFLTKQTTSNMKEVNLGFNVLKVLSTFDIGQSVIVEGEKVLGIEGVDGTDNLIKRCNCYISESAVFIKSAKKNQSMNMDIPTIGMDTINLLKESNIRGVAIEGAQVINLEKVIELCDMHNIFLYNE